VVKGSAYTAGETPAQGERADAPARQQAAGEPRRFPPAWWAWAGALGVAAVALFVCYMRLSGTVPDDSDGADQALQAWAMLHGNWLLHGWTVGDVSYYTTELPEYILVELVRGLGTDVIHISAAITYTLLVLLAGFAAKGRATGREGLVRALIAAGILLAPQLDGGVALLIQQPDHIGTNVPVLVILIVLDRAPRRWYTPVAITVMLTWVIVADRVAVFTVAAPLVIVGVLRTCWAVGRQGKRPTSQWFEFCLIAAGVISFGAAELVVSVIRRLGGYVSLPLPNGLKALGTLPSHLGVTAVGVLKLYGADLTGTSGVTAAFAAVHLAGLALALWGICRAYRRFFSTTDLIVPVMATGIAVNLAAYVFSTVPVNWFDAREIAALLPFGAVLAGRQLAGPLGRPRLTPVLAGVLACYVAALGYGAAQPPVNASEKPVVAFLEAHHLATGLGTYTESNILTLDSGGRVVLRTVSWRRTGAVPRDYESEASWYDPRLHYANFVMTNSGDETDRRDGRGVSLIPVREIFALGGTPAHIYHYQTFTIYVFNHNLLADLGGPPNSTPGDIP
jgi:hypothetical protein